MTSTKTCDEGKEDVDAGLGTKYGSLRAIVFGSTGATGIQVVQTLLQRSNKWSSVVSVSRRKVSEMLPPEANTKNLQEVVVKDMFDLDLMRDALKEAGEADSVFVCTGTTRGAAGGAEGFKKVEVDIPRTIATALTSIEPSDDDDDDGGDEISRLHVSVVSAQGANADLGFAPDWIHPLLYVKTLGQKERVFTDRQSRFRSVSLFRPGMLNRLKGDRWHENVLNRLGMGLRVDRLASAMVTDAERRSASSCTETVQTFEGNGVIGEMASLHSSS